MLHHDPDNPANVDQRDRRVGVIAVPEPVRLTGGGPLEDDLFAFDEVDWDGIATALAGAPDLIAQKLGVEVQA